MGKPNGGGALRRFLESKYMKIMETRLTYGPLGLPFLGCVPWDGRGRDATKSPEGMGNAGSGGNHLNFVSVDKAPWALLEGGEGACAILTSWLRPDFSNRDGGQRPRPNGDPKCHITGYGALDPWMRTGGLGHLTFDIWTACPPLLPMD